MTRSLDGQHILLGVTGGIAAYKSLDLVRRLRERGAEVRVCMTQGAQSFVTPLSFQAVSGQPVHSDLLDPQAEAAMGHIELARWADLVLVAPATADFLARHAAGLAGGLLDTLCLATEAPLVMAPAMNHRMWQHPATVDNCATLRARGVRLLGPASGDQACGETGPGRMLEPLDIVEALNPDRSWQGERVLITAGPTYEDLDPVRYLGNRSSGRMGFAIARAAADAGAQVVLVAGPVHLSTPPGVERIDVRTAREMHQAVMDRISGVSVFVAAAAVADFRPATVSEAKIKKGDSERLNVELERNPDILAEVAARTEDRPFTVGFAAETDHVVEYARKKLSEKRIDLIAANHVGAAEGGFDCPRNALDVLWQDGEERIPMMEKQQVARHLLRIIETRRAREPRPIAHA